MQVRLYNDLHSVKIPGLKKFQTAIESDNFAQADVKKIGDNLYRARLNRNDRLLFAIHSYQDESFCLVLEYLPNHAYEKSRFLHRGVSIDESKIPTISSASEVSPQPMTYVNPQSDHFYILDKVISFDDEQQLIYDQTPPLVIVGSAGSGKTALTLEKMKHAIGDILYVSLSPFLVQSAQQLYYARDYQNADQNIDFLSFKEFLESIQVPAEKEVTLKDFEHWFNRQKGNKKQLDPHKLFEEFRGVITGPVSDDAWLSREQYLALGVKQSIFPEEQRASVYDLFERYMAFLREQGFFDPNILSHRYLQQAEAKYDFIVIDEIQDITNIQLYLILKTLREAGDFLLCGDANQIVHPNFFSWSKLKSLFFENRDLVGHGETMRVLHANYRNSPLVTEVANQILKLKHARFGSIDRESNYLVSSMSRQAGTLQLLTDTEKVKQDLNDKTAKSTRFAVLVMHPAQKPLARQWFSTPLVFSIQEAKGLEYENIILFNFVSDESAAFNEICRNVTSEQLETSHLDYKRVKDKTDKSLEVFKFFINALYVAVTRAVKNIYIIESEQQHPAISLLQLERFAGGLSLEKQTSSQDEWQREARQLELQGKQEQADAIRTNVLQQKQVPWPVLDKARFAELYAQLGNSKNKKQQLQALEYALLHDHYPTLTLLNDNHFKPAKQPLDKALKQVFRSHFMTYDLKNPSAVLRDTDKYGLDFRTPFNLTPLMVASKLGNVNLVQALVERGADPSIVADNGATAFHMALGAALNDDKYARHKFSQIYDLLLPSSLSVQVSGRLIKLDNHLMALFLLHVMIAQYFRHLAHDIDYCDLFTAKNLAEILSMLPDSVLPERRKKQSYISGVLSQNEVTRDHKYNRKLFYRYRRGHYMFNPLLKLKIQNDWVPITELLPLEDIGLYENPKYTGGEYQYFADNWRKIREKNLEWIKDDIRHAMALLSDKQANKIV